MDTKKKGQITEANVMLSLLKKFTVLIPYGENQKYDFVLEKNGEYKTVQCKTGRIRNGAIIFNLYSVVRDKDTKKHKKVTYHNVDYFGVYCEATNKSYLVSSEILPQYEGTLRVDEPAIKYSFIRYAKDFEL